MFATRTAASYSSIRTAASASAGSALSGSAAAAAAAAAAVAPASSRRCYASAPVSTSSSSSSSAAMASLLKTTAAAALDTPGLAFTAGPASTAASSSNSGNSKRHPHAPLPATASINMCTAIRDAQAHALSADDTTCIFGEDVAFGGVFRATMGLAEEFGRERVFNTPLTEQGIVGFGIGMADMGHSAVAELQFADYIFPAFDQIVNEAAKYSYRSGGKYSAGKLTIRSPCMSVGHGGLYHSQSVEQFFMPVPGIKVVIPRSPIQAKGLLLSAIRDPNPVIFLEPKILYRSSVEHVPKDDFTLPLSEAEVVMEGSDVTLLSWGAPLYSCAQAIDMLKNPPEAIAKHVPASVRDAKVELIDLRTILPWDREAIVKSVNKTQRIVIVHEAPVTAGVGAEIGAHIQERCFLRLEAPACRIGGWDTPFPLHEAFYKPEAIRILDGLVRTLTY